MAEISKTADQALACLVELSEHGPMTVAEVSRAVGLNRTVVHRLLNTLHQRGFIIRQADGYVPGATIVRMATLVQPELRAAAIQTMRRLARDVGETVVLHIADGSEAVVLEQVVGTTHTVRVEHAIGSRHELWRGASGRALLSFLDERTRTRVLRRSDSPDLRTAEVAGVRETGYAISHDELQNGVHGIAAPVREPGGLGVASLGIVVPSTRAVSLLQHIEPLIGAAGRLGKALYGTGLPDGSTADPPRVAGGRSRGAAGSAEAQSKPKRAATV